MNDLISSTIFKNYYREISEVRLKTDNNLIFSSYEERRSYKFSQMRETADLRKDHNLFPGTFSQMTFITSGNTIIYLRNYRKLFDLITRIGGFLNGIIYSTQIILFFYSENIILWKCISSIISTDEVNERLGLNNIRKNSNNVISIYDNNNNNNRRNEELSNVRVQQINRENENENENNSNKMFPASNQHIINNNNNNNLR